MEVLGRGDGFGFFYFERQLAPGIDLDIGDSELCWRKRTGRGSVTVAADAWGVPDRAVES